MATFRPSTKIQTVIGSNVARLNLMQGGNGRLEVWTHLQVSWASWMYSDLCGDVNVYVSPFISDIAF